MILVTDCMARQHRHIRSEFPLPICYIISNALLLSCRSLDVLDKNSVVRFVPHIIHQHKSDHLHCKVGDTISFLLMALHSELVMFCISC